MVPLLGVISAYVSVFTISGPSMSPTHLLKDVVFSNHLAYGCRPPYTDIVVSETGAPERDDLVMYFDIQQGITGAKRIVRIPGDTVSMRLTLSIRAR